ncbi:MAG: IS4 family transposase [Pseudomonadota bacterium]|nr:IS4 family transposase [Pseudomonadota bacterium]
MAEVSTENSKNSPAPVLAPVLAPVQLPPWPPPLPPPLRRGQKRRKAVAAEDLVGKPQVALLEQHLQNYRSAYTHPNRKLHYDDVVVGLLYAFYNPLARSTRTLEALSQLDLVRGGLSVDRICRSTFSDALKLFDPHLLRPLLEELRKRVPDLGRRDPDLATVVRKIIAADGSFLSIAADAAHAIVHTKTNGKKQGQVRLNLQLEVLGGVPEATLSVSGIDEGSETAAFIKLLQSGVIYLIDRNFVDFKFMTAVKDKQSDFVLRAQKSKPNFDAQRELALSDKDREAGVLSDRIGRLPGSAGAPPPDMLVRELNFKDPRTGLEIRVLTSLLEVPAHVVGTLYRYRWQIELFFRWLKVWANFDHLISHSPNGLTTQFYVAVIGVLLMHINSGKRISKYAYLLLQQVAMGLATAEQALEILTEIERRKDLERARLERKKAEKKNA